MAVKNGSPLSDPRDEVIPPDRPHTPRWEHPNLDRPGAQPHPATPEGPHRGAPHAPGERAPVRERTHA